MDGVGGPGSGIDQREDRYAWYDIGQGAWCSAEQAPAGVSAERIVAVARDGSNDSSGDDPRYKWWRVPGSDVEFFESPTQLVRMVPGDQIMLATASPELVAHVEQVRSETSPQTAKVEIDVFGSDRYDDPTAYRVTAAEQSTAGFFFAPRRPQEPDELFPYATHPDLARAVFIHGVTTRQPIPTFYKFLPDPVIDLIVGLMLSLEGQAHARVKRATRPTFKKTAIAHMWEGLEVEAVDLLADRLATNDTLDLVEFGSKFTSSAIAQMLGLTPTYLKRRGDDLKTVVDNLVVLNAGGEGMTSDFVPAMQLAIEMSEEVEKLVEAGDPQIDPAGLMPILINKFDYAGIDLARIFGFVITAGLETSIGAISTAAIEIATKTNLDHLPRLQEAIAAVRSQDQTLTDSDINDLFFVAAAEVVETYPPIAMTTRTIYDSPEVREQLLDLNIPGLDSEMLDKLFSDRGFVTFRVDFSAVSEEANVSPFGFGIHRCIGAELAKMEVAVALKMFATQVELESLVGPVQRREHVTIPLVKAAVANARIMPGSSVEKKVRPTGGPGAGVSRAEFGPAELIASGSGPQRPGDTAIAIYPGSGLRAIPVLRQSGRQVS